VPAATSAEEQDQKKCAEKCALPAHVVAHGTRFHDLRHFYASALIAANLNPKVIQARLGHATVSETMDTYGISSRTLTTSESGPSTRP
jgi:integrase